MKKLACFLILFVALIGTRARGFENHEIGLSGSEATFSFVSGFDVFEVGLKVHRKVYQQLLQLGAEFELDRVAVSGVARTSTLLLLGPTLNLAITDRRIKNAVFFFLGLGFADTNISSMSFATKFRLGKRFQLTGYLSYTPSFSITLFDFGNERFDIELISFSVIF